MPAPTPEALSASLLSLLPYAVAALLLLAVWLGWRWHQRKQRRPRETHRPGAAEPRSAQPPLQKRPLAAPAQPAAAARRTEPQRGPAPATPARPPPPAPASVATPAAAPVGAPARPTRTPPPAAAESVATRPRRPVPERPVAPKPSPATPAAQAAPTAQATAAPSAALARPPQPTPAAARPLPPARSNALPPPVHTAAPAPATPPRLLLVDDSAVARAKLRKLFDSAGYQVQLAKDGVDALEQLTAAGPGHFALMITDVEMPRMNGLELIQALASGGSMPAMPILTISGHDNLAAELAACPAVRGVFRKPWQDEQLLAQVRALVGAHGLGALLH